MTLIPAPSGVAEPRVEALPVEPSARTYTLASLVGMVREGHVRVPHFQRSLRWNTSDAVSLIDSVLKGYPIGSLLLWKRRGPAELVTLGSVTIDAPATDEALYVVDGQQRVTAFVNTFHPEAGLSGAFALVYDLKERPFRVRARRSSEQNSIPLPVLFDLNLLLRWARDNPQYLDLIDEINTATTRLREFHVPAYEVRSEDSEALRHIYDRMNNTGKRLSRAEAFWGLFAPEETIADSRTSLTTLQEHVATSLEWGRIDDDTILRVFLARRGPDVTRDIHLEFDAERRPGLDFPDETLETAHLKALDALERTVAFLRDEARVPHFTFLAYRYLLVVLARFFALFPEPDARNVELLRRWYWRAALAGPGVARGSATGAMRQLSARIRRDSESESVQRLLALVESKPHLRPDPTAFRANHAASHMMLCALWDRRPVSPDTGLPFASSDLAVAIESGSTPTPACPEIYARADLPKPLRLAIGNRVVMPGIPRGEVWGALRAAADGSDEDVPSGLLPSHLFERDYLRLSPAQCVERRTEAFDLVLTAFLRRVTGEGFDDTPPLRDLELDDLDDEVPDDGLLW